MYIYKICINAMECYSASKSEDILMNAIAWVEFKMDMLSEFKQSQKDKHNMIPLV